MNFFSADIVAIHQRMQLVPIVLIEILDLLKEPVFEKSKANWVDKLKAVPKHYNKTKYYWTKITPIQASLKKKEWYVYQKHLGKKKKRRQKMMRSG